MSKNQTLLEELTLLLKRKKSNIFYAEKLNISVKEVEDLRKELRELKKENSEIPIENLSLGEIVKKVNNEKGTVESTITSNFEPKNDIELAQLHKIDLTKYVITNYWSKLLPNGKFTSSVFSKRKQAEDYTGEDFEKFLKNYKPFYIVDKTPNTHFTSAIDVELSIADFHLGKKTLEDETIEDKKEQYLKVVKELISDINSIYGINKIVFPISNDYFHTDNYQNQTTNGTPQDTLVSYDKEYEEGFDLLVQAISFLLNFSNNVEIILVQGNHDRTKSFYLAHGLEVFFRADKRVSFQREHSTTKYTVLGNTFIGYHHGNCKIDDLPLIFATSKSSEAFGNAKFRAVSTGDKHHYMAKEIKGVRIQQMPSLSGTDRWHLDNNYINNIRSGIATVYHPIKGRIAEFESRI